MIHVKTVSETKIEGYIFQSGDILHSKDSYYSDTFENVEKNVAMISLRKPRPLLTALAISIPVVTVILVIQLTYRCC